MKEHSEFLWLLILATLFRLFAVLLLTQGGYVYDGHPVYDYQFYRRIGELSLEGYYPSVHYWLEYPPVFSWLIVGIYRLSLLLPAMRDPIFWFHNFLGSFLAMVEAGNLGMVYAIQCRLAGRSVALRAAWMYALLFWPLYVMLGWFDAVPLLLLLVTVYALITNRPILAGLAAGVAFMTKLIPAVVAPVALRAFASRKQVISCALAGVISVAAIATPFLLLSPKLFLAGFQSALSRSSWETIWALMEGYFDIGVVAPLDTHFDAATATIPSHPSTLPWPLITGAFALIYLLALSRVRASTPRATVAFCGLAITLLLMFSKGYSPQFIVYLLPFVILIMPNGWGVVFVVLLSLANALQFPLFPMIFRQELWVLWAAVGLRTLLWTSLCAVYAAEMAGGAPGWLAKVRDRLAVPATAAVLLVVIGLAWPLLDRYVAGRGEYNDLQQYLRPLRLPSQGAVLSTRDLIGYVYPFLDGAAVYVLPENWEQQEDQTTSDLRDFAAKHRQVWLLLDYARGEDARHGFLERTLVASGAKSTNRWFETFRLVGYVAPEVTGGEAWRDAKNTFGRMMRLESYAIASTVDDGSPFRVKLRWRCIGQVDTDLSLFVHLVSREGAIVAQRDKLLTRLGAGTSACRADHELHDADDVLVPVGTPPGEYEVRIGLYRADNGTRFRDEEGGDSVLLGRVSVARAVTQRAPRLPAAPVDLGGGLRLLGYEMGAAPRAGEEMRLALYLQAGGPAGIDYRLAVGLARDTVLVAQSESVPGGKEYPPGKWRGGEIVRDLRQIGAVEAGRYTVAVKLLGMDGAPVEAAGGGRGMPGGWVPLPGEVVVEQ